MNKKDFLKEKTDILFKLAEGAWNEYDSRRTSAWKINLSLWAGLGLMIWFTEKEEVHTDSCWTIVSFCIVALLYLYFQYGLFKSNYKDQKKRHHYLKEIHKLNRIKKPKGFNKRPSTSTRCLFTNWYVGVIVLTLILFAAACYFLVRDC